MMSRISSHSYDAKPRFSITENEDNPDDPVCGWIDFGIGDAEWVLFVDSDDHESELEAVRAELEALRDNIDEQLALVDEISRRSSRQLDCIEGS